MRVCDKCSKKIKDGWGNIMSLGNKDHGDLCEDCKNELKLLILKWKKGSKKE